MSELFMTGSTHAECRELVMKYHYSKRMPSASSHYFAWRKEGGLFGDHGDAVACAIYGQPVNRNWPHDALEMQRLVRVSDFEKQLSKFVAWSVRWLRQNTACPFIISYADWSERHHGGIYQASGWVYVDCRESRHIGFRDANGNFIHGRTSNARHGTSSVPRIAEIEPTWTPVYGEEKYLYLMPLRQKLSPILKRFGWEVLPYPKPNATGLVDERCPQRASKEHTLAAAPNSKAVA